MQAKVCAGGRCKRREVCTSSMMRPMDRCGVVSRAAPWRENEAAEPTSARATMERYSIVGVSVTMWLSKVGAE